VTQRTFVVARPEAGQRLADWLRARLRLAPEAVLGLLRGRSVRLGGSPCTDPSRRLQAGLRVEVRLSAKRPRSGSAHSRGQRKARQGTESASTVLSASALRFVDEQIVIVDKPAGLTTMRHAEDVAEFGDRARRFLPPTLADLLPEVLARAGHGRRSRPLCAAEGKAANRKRGVRAVHRLDKETSGLVVFARTPAAEQHLGRQFREHTIERVYLALVRGQAREARLESWLVRDRGDGRRGSGKAGERGCVSAPSSESASAPSSGRVSTPRGQHAVTHVRVREELGEYTLVECRLDSGRTHQIRIHLGEAGTPLCGERIYDRPLHGRPLPDGSGAGRVMLHAAVLGLDHPATGERLSWTAPLPDDMQAVLERLRGGARKAP
jgi:23S rRNA pseudouridine1911/1915/1917 synthase